MTGLDGKRVRLILHPNIDPDTPTEGIYRDTPLGFDLETDTGSRWSFHSYRREVLRIIPADRPKPVDWTEIQPPDPAMTQCMECGALVLKTAYGVHESWHEQQEQEAS